MRVTGEKTWKNTGKTRTAEILGGLKRFAGWPSFIIIPKTIKTCLFQLFGAWNHKPPELNYTHTVSDYLHLRGYFGDCCHAVVLWQSVVVENDPLWQPQLVWLSPVTGERVNMGHVLVCQDEVVSGSVHIPGNLQKDLDSVALPEATSRMLTFSFDRPAWRTQPAVPFWCCGCWSWFRRRAQIWEARSCSECQSALIEWPRPSSGTSNPGNCPGTTVLHWSLKGTAKQ